MVLLLRLSPVFPFNLLNDALGITKVSLKDYFLASVGMLPGTVMYVYIGSLAGDIATIGTQTQNSAPDWTSWAINITIGVTTIAIDLYQDLRINATGRVLFRVVTHQSAIYRVFA